VKGKSRENDDSSPNVVQKLLVRLVRVRFDRFDERLAGIGDVSKDNIAGGKEGRKDRRQPT
jgi:hypothetical protein